MALRKKVQDLALLMAINLIYSLMYLVCCYDAGHWNGMDDEYAPSFFDKFFNRLYFSVVTFSTVGYGDITPTSRTARTLVMLQILFNINGMVRLLLG